MDRLGCGAAALGWADWVAVKADTKLWFEAVRECAVVFDSNLGPIGAGQVGCAKWTSTEFSPGFSAIFGMENYK